MSKIIVIEGPDKLGKETQSQLLCHKLNDLGIKTVIQEIAAKDSITYDKIYKMLATGDAVKYPSAFQALHTSNRLIWQKNEYPKLSQKFDVIILDRWTISSHVYGNASGELKDGEIECLCEGLIKPDIVFVFRGESFKREKKDDAYEKDPVFQKKVREEYDKWLLENKDIGVAINANRDKYEVLEELFLIVKERTKIL